MIIPQWPNVDKSILLLKSPPPPFTFQSECLSFTYLFTPLKSKTYGSFKSKGEARIFVGSLDKCPQISGHKDTKEQKQQRLGVLHHQGSLLSYPGERGERHIDTSARHALNSSITALLLFFLALFLYSALSPLSLSLLSLFNDKTADRGLLIRHSFLHQWKVLAVNRYSHHLTLVCKAGGSFSRIIYIQAALLLLSLVEHVLY